MQGQSGDPSPSPDRHSLRLSITVPHHIHQALVSRSQQEGRSISNLAAFLLECALLSRAKD
ncbi:MAG: hypothetical protein VKO65_00920 [Cyanobacteriota bacterium]|nr:hypothetical protein [Cyanobacteriota bacterium]